MGGSGSGRWWLHSKKDTVEDCLKIDVNWCVRKNFIQSDRFNFGTLTWSRGERQTASAGCISRCDEAIPYISLRYTWREKEKLDYKIYLTTSSPYFGGVRWWFICPLTHNGIPCESKVGKLYLPPGGKYFGCRHCYDLTYTSCQEHDSRVDAMFRNPEIFLSQLKSKNPKSTLPALKAYVKAMGKI